METHDVIDTWVEGIAASLSENWEGEDDLSLEELAYDIVDNSKTALLSDALSFHKQTGLSKDDFIAQLNHYSDWSKAMMILVKAAAIASEQVIPD